MTKLLPEHKRSNKTELHKIQKQMKNFIYLKESTSSVNENFEIAGPKFKGDNNKPSIKKLSQFKKSKLYIPIVSEKRKFYETKMDDFNVAEILSKDDETIILENNEVEFNKIKNINNKYSKGAERINYSYRNHLGEIYDVMDAYENTNMGYNINLPNDIEVFSDCFNVECKTLRGTEKYNKHKLLGPTEFIKDNNYVEGNRVSNVGFVKKIENSIKINKDLKAHVNDAYKIEKKDIFGDTPINVLKTTYSIGDSVKLCLEGKITLLGEIVNIEGDTLFIKPNEDSNITQTLKVEESDPNVNLSKWHEDDVIESNNTCYDEEYNKYAIYTYDKDVLNKEDLENALNKMIPTINTIINTIPNKEDIKSITELNTILHKYDISIDDFTFKNFNSIKQILEENNNYKPKSFKLEKQIDYNIKDKRDNYNVVKNHILDELVPYYGKYPYFNSKLDSDTMRLKWIESKPDNGNLFFKYHMKKINEKFLETKTSKIESIQSFVYKLELKNTELKEDLENELDAIVKAGTEKCINLRLVKIYNSLEQLELDNNREIHIDEDKLTEGETDTRVDVNHYAILIISPLEKQIYKRIELSNGSQIWNLEDDTKLDTLITTYKDFCNSQGMSVEEIDLDFFKGTKKCKFSEFYGACLPVRLVKLKEKIDKNEDSIKENKENIEKLRSSDHYLELLDNEITKLNYLLELETIKDQNKYLYLEELQSSYNPPKEDDLYSELYYKIDKYLENIKDYEKKEYYLALDILLKKYGRKASDIKSENENPKMVYCRLGNKQIVCVHHLNYIDHFKGLKTLEEVTNENIEQFGIETEGTIWCNNCGEEISIGDYETAGDFTKSGARDTTHAEINLDEQYESKENSEMVELLRKTLLEGNIEQTNDDTLNIIKIINIILSIMGITLTKEDNIKVLHSTELIAKTNIKSKDEWTSNAKQKSKKTLSKSILEKAYNAYKIRNIILFTSSNLFLYLQTGIPEYSITKTFSSCKPNLYGYPIDKTNKFLGIDYLVCILENLSAGGGDWETLKKTPLKDNIIKIIDLLLKDDIINYRIIQKKQFLIENTKEYETFEESPQRIWNEFRPPLELFSVEKESFSKFNIGSILDKLNDKKKNMDIINASILSFLNNEELLSLKLIEEINNEINDSTIENTKFDPTPLDNACCLQTIDSNYNYLNYFIEKNERITELYELLLDYNNKKKILNDRLKTLKIFINSDVQRKLQQFNRQIGLSDEELNKNNFKQFFTNIITNGPFLGKKHLFVDNICDYTGEKLLDINSKDYNKDEYQTVIEEINQSKLFYGNYKKEALIDDLLGILLQTNTELATNEYLVNFHTNLNKGKNIEKLWNDLSDQIIVEIDIICETLRDNLSLKTTENFKKILTNLGEYTNILEDDISINKQNAQDKFFLTKEQVIQSYFTIYLKNTVSKINNRYSISETPFLPEEWKISDPDIEKEYKRILHIKNLSKKYIPIAERNFRMFQEILQKITALNKNVHLLKGQKIVYDCNGNQLNTTQYTYENVSSLLHYIFVYTISTILNTDVSEADVVGLLPDDLELEKCPDDPIDDLDFTRELEKTKNIESDLIVDILKLIDDDYNYINKHTNTYIQSVIEQKAETAKESNLKFIQELDKETWASLKTMISLGMDTWKNLSSKSKDIYVPVDEVGEETVATDADMEATNRIQAQQELGNDFTDQQYNDWKENKEANAAEDRLAYEERDVLEDDDESLE